MKSLFLIFSLLCFVSESSWAWVENQVLIAGTVIGFDEQTIRLNALDGRKISVKRLKQDDSVDLRPGKIVILSRDLSDYPGQKQKRALSESEILKAHATFVR
jgi:hypothetical protein